MTIHRLLGVACLAALLPAAAAAQKTTYDYDKTATFAAYRTYAVKVGTSSGQPLVDNRIVAAIEAQLTARGFTRNDTTPDVVVAFHIAYDKEKDISAFSSGPMYGGYGWGYYGWGGGWGSTTTDVRVRDILVGTLAIDMIDVKRMEVVWRGLGTKEVDTKAKPEKREENINKAVEKIMRNYPPKVKS